ncbi:hypothetical protein MITS9509_00432 [Synechococcus sp. MIT S9509]|nr:hypothetical protein MITS9509_00432 [Synechococcus sp. MIT S9509]
MVRIHQGASVTEWVLEDARRLFLLIVRGSNHFAYRVSFTKHMLSCFDCEFVLNLLA